MLIANPIYDSVFKFLMEDPEIARELLATIMQEDIIDIQLLPQEHTAGSARHLVSVFRVDFKATIKTAAGEQKKILIELQKGKQPIDVMRFRRYLGANYSEPDTVDNRKVGLPIVTIYFLGFELSLKYPVLKINRVYTNVATGEIVEGKDDFVEQLTHDSYIVQIPQLPLVTQNKVEQVLSVFSQRWIGKSHVYSHWMYDYPTGVTDDKLLVKILSRLRKATLSPDVKEDIYIEEEIDESIDNIIRTKNLELLEKENKIEEINVELLEKENLLQEKDSALQEKDSALQATNKALIEKENKIEEQERRLAAMEAQIALLLKER